MDDEIKRELMDSFNDIYEDVELCLAELNDNSDPELLNRLFRAIHNAKGNAGMMQLEAIVAFTHSLEEVAGALRERKFARSPGVCEVIQIGMDRLRDLHQRDIFAKHFDNLQEIELSELLFKLARSDEKSADSAIANFLGFVGIDASFSSVSPSVAPPQEQPPPSDDLETRPSPRRPTKDKLDADLIFFQEVALQIDNQSQHWHGRSIQLFDWAMKVNRLGGNLIPYNQFAAAIYMHDIGMSFIPQSILDKETPYTDEEWSTIHQHPRWGYDFLSRMPGWEVASVIIMDHHEHVDGSGYPNSKKGEEIHPGARILAIIDAFFSITRGRADRQQRKSVIRAISEINSRADSQFDSAWIQCFNEMIKIELKSGLL